MGSPFKGSVAKVVERYGQHSAVVRVRQGVQLKQSQLHYGIAAGQAKISQYINYENYDRLWQYYYDKYNWLSGVTVVEAQEQARYLETRLNSCRRSLKDERDRLDEVAEELRSITAELEHTSRGDSRNLLLRQKEHELIQHELKVQKEVVRSEFVERETFTQLMNANRVHQETERDYRHQMSFVSIGMGILGTCLGFFITVGTNRWKFAKMESTLDQKIVLMSDIIRADMRAFHGIEPEELVEEVKPGLLATLYQLIASLSVRDVQPMLADEAPSSGPTVDPVIPAPEPVQVATVVTQTLDVPTAAPALEPIAPEPIVVERVVEPVVVERVIERVVPADCTGHKEELDIINRNYDTLLQSIQTLQSAVTALTPAIIEPPPVLSPPPLKLTEDVTKSTEYIIEALGLKSSKTPPNILEVSKLLEIQKTVLTTLTSLSNITQSNHSDLVTVLSLLQENMISNTTDLCDGSLQLSTLVHSVQELTARIAGLEHTTNTLLSTLDKVELSVSDSAEQSAEYSSISSQASEGLYKALNGHSSDLANLRQELCALSSAVCEVNSRSELSAQSLADIATQLEGLAEIRHGVEGVGGVEQGLEDEVQQGVSEVQQGLEHLTTVLCLLQQQGHDSEQEQRIVQRELQSLKERLDEVYLLVTQARELEQDRAEQRKRRECEERERREGEEREAAEARASERLEIDRLTSERLELERLVLEIRETQIREVKRLETQRLDEERLEALRLEAEGLEAEGLEALRLEVEREAEKEEVERMRELPHEKESMAVESTSHIPSHIRSDMCDVENRVVNREGGSLETRRGLAVVYSAFVITSTIIAAFFTG